VSEHKQTKYQSKSQGKPEPVTSVHVTVSNKNIVIDEEEPNKFRYKRIVRLHCCLKHMEMLHYGQYQCILRVGTEN